ncbi:hypothetical protein Tco_0329866, partial [Tanacetum coccineum]
LGEQNKIIRLSNERYVEREMKDGAPGLGLVLWMRRGGSKRYKSSGSSSFNTEFGEASINLNANVGDDEEDEVHEI